MRVSIFGLGYVGTVSAACLASQGHEVIGVDQNSVKVDFLNGGKSPIIEKDLESLISTAVNSGKLRATTDGSTAVSSSDITLVCVGTPSAPNGSLDLKYIERVCDEIGAYLREKDSFHVVVIRSTVLPGTLRGVVEPALRSASGKQLDVDFGIASNPEFLREGTAVNDYYHPPMTVIGASGERAADMTARLYEKIEAPLIKTRIETAELVKYSCNAWHAVKVCFANEIGNISKELGVDGHEVMDIFCQDDKLNLSRYYMRPGFAFGGSCLPKDVRALTYQARRLDIDTPLLNSVMDSNERQIQRAFEMVNSKKGRKLGVLGISFKAGTDDLRESPIVELVERLLGKGYDIRIFDRNVRMAGLMGANREYINEKIPHLMQMLVADLDELFSHAETVIVGNSDTQRNEFERLLSDQHDIVDLVRISEELEGLDRYDGICW